MDLFEKGYACIPSCSTHVNRVTMLYCSTCRNIGVHHTVRIHVTYPSFEPIYAKNPL